MNMKKLVAVVLAVILAVSAMAINVFAAEGETYQIPLRPAGQTGATNTRTYEYKFEFPIYGLYSYLSQDQYLELNLPKNFRADNTNTVWYIETNLGNKVAITQETDWKGGPFLGTNASDNGTYETVYVNFGAFDRPYINDNNWATIRQGSFNEVTTITLTAKVTINNYPGWDSSWSDGDAKNDKMYVQLWTAGDDGIKNYNPTEDQIVTGSNLFSQNMNVTKTADTSSAYGAFEFVSHIEGLEAKDWTDPMSKKESYVDANGETQEYKKNIDLVWDMTLQNRAYIINAESARVVVKLHNKWWGNELGYTKGIAVYSLYLADTRMTDTTLGQIWWGNGANYNRVAKRVAFMSVMNEKVTELSFEISPEKLYDATYGISAGITSTFRIYAETETPASQLGWSASGDRWVYDHYTNDAYIELTMPAEEDNTQDLTPDDPAQSDPGSDTVDEPTDVDVTEDPTPAEEPADTNPPTGIVLAVLPMVVAAAAVVASKRR